MRAHTTRHRIAATGASGVGGWGCSAAFTSCLACSAVRFSHRFFHKVDGLSRRLQLLKRVGGNLQAEFLLQGLFAIARVAGGLAAQVSTSSSNLRIGFFFA